VSYRPPRVYTLYDCVCISRYRVPFRYYPAGYLDKFSILRLVLVHVYICTLNLVNPIRARIGTPRSELRYRKWLYTLCEFLPCMLHHRTRRIQLRYSCIPAAVLDHLAWYGLEPRAIETAVFSLNPGSDLYGFACLAFKNIFACAQNQHMYSIRCSR
jgi:hypothetical protein